MPRAEWTVPDLYLYGPDTKFGAKKKASLAGYYWYVRHKVGGQDKEVATGCRREQIDEARHFLADYLEGLRRGGGARPSADPLMSVLIDKFVAEKVPRLASGDTAKTWAKTLSAFLGDRRVSEITPGLCQEYDEQMRSAGYGQWTRRRALGVLRSILAYARDEKLIDAVPKLWLPGEGPTRAEWITRSELAAIIRFCRQRPTHRAHILLFVLLSIHYGQRKEAVLELRWEPWEGGGYVDLGSGMIDFRRNHAQHSKKRRAGPLPIPHRLLRLLRVAQRRSKSGWVIEFGGRQVKDVKTAWETVRRETGVNVNVHDLGHTCVSWMLQGGINAFAVSKHVAKSVAIIEKVYGHIVTTALVANPKHTLRWAPSQFPQSSRGERPKRKPRK